MVKWINNIKARINTFKARKAIKYLKQHEGVQVVGMPTMSCPCCKHKLDIATRGSGQGPKPKPKDIGLCHFCGGILEISKQGGLIPITDETWNSMPVYAKEQAISASRKCAAMWKPQQKRSELEGMFDV